MDRQQALAWVVNANRRELEGFCIHHGIPWRGLSTDQMRREVETHIQAQPAQWVTYNPADFANLAQQQQPPVPQPRPVRQYQGGAVMRRHGSAIGAAILAAIALIVGFMALNRDDKVIETKVASDPQLTARVNSMETSLKATAANVDKLTKTVGSLADNVDKRLNALDKKVAALATSTVPTTTVDPNAPTTTVDPNAPVTTIDPNAPTSTTPTASTTPGSTATTLPGSTPTATTVPLTSAGTMPALPTDASHGKWTIKENADISKDPIVKSWLARLRDPAPTLWPTFPNVPNKLVSDFRVVKGTQVPDGVEYGQDDSPFCEQDMRCDFVVPAWHYRLITGDYSFQGMTCQNTDAKNRRGCLLLLINVMDQSYTWRNQSVDNGFTVMGRYWNGDKLDFGTWGVVSHAAANMLNLPTMRNPLTGDVLNAGSPGNAGANCGVVNACGVVDATVVIHAGDRILAVAKTTVTR